MKHHFHDWLNRDKKFWTITPNRERWAYRFENLLDAPIESSILTVTKKDLNWERIFEFENLSELTLHEASKQQFEAVKKLENLTALRVSHARSKTLEFIVDQNNLEELVLEYVSGFDDLSPLTELPKLTALHMENLRSVRNFHGLSGCRQLKCLSIYGALDWKQPIESLDFLKELSELEYLDFGFINFLSGFPVFKPLASMKKLNEIRLGLSATTLENYAYLEAKFPDIKGAKRLPYRIIEQRNRKITTRDVRGRMPLEEFKAIPDAFLSDEGGRFIYEAPQLYLLGKGTRYYSGPIEKVMQRRDEHKAKYDKLVQSFSN